MFQFIGFWVGIWSPRSDHLKLTPEGGIFKVDPDCVNLEAGNYYKSLSIETFLIHEKKKHALICLNLNSINIIMQRSTESMFTTTIIR